MNRKFGGGKPPVGTPSLALSCVVVVTSLLAGASVIHNIYKPDLINCVLNMASEQQLSESGGMPPSRLRERVSENQSHG
ncbi:hypothetical protein Ancab_012870 [Ancistrocladus abbreviatus]